MESRRGSYSVVESRRRSIWWASRVKKNELRLSYGLTLSYQENYWHWDDICACCVDSQRPCVDFTVVWYDRCRSLSLINARVNPEVVSSVLCGESVESLTCEMRNLNIDRHLMLYCEMEWLWVNVVKFVILGDQLNAMSSSTFYMDILELGLLGFSCSWFKLLLNYLAYPFICYCGCFLKTVMIV